ncbi:hypothetical protein D3C75_1272440 [compost metagenome]
MQPDMQGRQIKTAAAAGNTQALTDQRHQTVFTQKLTHARRGHQNTAAFFQLLTHGVNAAVVYAGDFCPGLQFTLLTLQLFQQFCADFATL